MYAATDATTTTIDIMTAKQIGLDMEEALDGIFILGVFFLPIIITFVLVTFSPVRRLRQPLKCFVIALTSGVVAALSLSALAMARGTVSSRAFVFFVAISILIGAGVSLLASSETIIHKTNTLRKVTIRVGEVIDLPRILTQAAICAFPQRRPCAI